MVRIVTENLTCFGPLFGDKIEEARKMFLDKMLLGLGRQTREHFGKSSTQEWNSGIQTDRSALTLY